MIFQVTYLLPSDRSLPWFVFIILLIYMQLDVVRVAEMMMLKLSEPLTVTWDDFSSVVLRPLRYQMMGSVLVRSIIINALGCHCHTLYHTHTHTHTHTCN